MKVGPVDCQAFYDQFVQGLLMGVIVSISLPDAYHGYIGVDRLQVGWARGGPATVMPDLQDRASLVEPGCQYASLRCGFAVSSEEEGHVVHL